MAKATTPSFVLTLKLNTNPVQNAVLDKRFSYGVRIYNTLVKHARKQLNKLNADKEYRFLLNEYATLKGSTPDIKRVRASYGKQLSDIRMSYGLSEYQFHAFVKIQQHRYKKHIDSNTAQKIATQVWKAVDKYLFDNGKCVHYRRYDDFLSMEGKNNASGIRFKDGRLYWNGLCVSVNQNKNDLYQQMALMHRVKYCRIKRCIMGSGYHYYLQLILEGAPPKKHVCGTGSVGIDIGTSTCAVVSDNGCILTVIGNNVKRYDAKIARLSRKLDRSRRANNPSNYNPDGTIKKGRKTWVYSNAYRRTLLKKHSLEQRQTASLKQSQKTLANEIIAQGTTIYAEQMSFSGLQHKAKDTTINKNGRFNRKKRFGKSLNNHAPARFLTILDRKLQYYDKELMFVNTKSFRASQYNHITDDYVKKKLSCRGQFINGHWIQRDLYSAFLLMNSNETLDTPDRSKCISSYNTFVKNHDLCINTLKHTLDNLPLSFGIRKNAS